MQRFGVAIYAEGFSIFIYVIMNMCGYSTGKYCRDS